MMSNCSICLKIEVKSNDNMPAGAIIERRDTREHR